MRTQRALGICMIAVFLHHTSSEKTIFVLT